jgi:flavodoxin
MKAIVAYFSETGNTRKVAEAIYEEIQFEKDIKQLAEVGAGSKGQPDAERLARARTFARDMIG